MAAIWLPYCTGALTPGGKSAGVRVACYYIDFVIEGDGDRRLAIELDGDNYHGPDRWDADIRRQKMLERLGRTFWRCWGSRGMLIQMVAWPILWRH